MFTGLIEHKGLLREVKTHVSGLTWQVQHDAADWVPSGAEPLQRGESIAVNGVCVTVTETTEESFFCDLSTETLARTSFKDLKPGRKLHLERALRASDRLGGHLVSGHVDRVGLVADTRMEGGFCALTVQLPRHSAPFCVEKGSITIDGVSLTINQVTVEENGVSVELMLIPQTLALTVLGDLRSGDGVNVEYDLMARHIVHTLKTLKEHGL